MKTLMLLVGTVLTQNLVNRLIHDTAEPVAKEAFRSSLKYSSRVFVFCLIGGLTFTAGLVLGSVQIANQISEVGAFQFTPLFGMSLGLLILGAVLTYLGAFSKVFLPRPKISRTQQGTMEVEMVFLRIADALLSRVEQAIRPAPQSLRSTPKPRTTEHDNYYSPSQPVEESPHSSSTVH